MDIKIGDVLKFTTKSIPGSVDMKVELCDDNIENIMKGLRELSVDKSDTVSSYFIKIIKDISNGCCINHSDAKLVITHLKRKGILHTINTEYLELIWPKDNRCPVLGNLFEMGYKNGKSKNLSPSLDRIVPKKGYIPGNLVIVSDIVNRLKSDASLEDMEKILKFYTNKNNKINNI